MVAKTSIIVLGVIKTFNNNLGGIKANGYFRNACLA